MTRIPARKPPLIAGQQPAENPPPALGFSPWSQQWSQARSWHNGGVNLLPRPPRRPYRRSGLYTSTVSPEEQAAMEAVRADLIADCGGLEAVSTARRLLIDLAAAAAVRCQARQRLSRVAQQLGRQAPPPRVAGGDARRAEAHLQGLLRDIGLERRVKPSCAGWLTSPRRSTHSPGCEAIRCGSCRTSAKRRWYWTASPIGGPTAGAG